MKNTRRTSSTKQGNSLWFGMIIGVLVGVGIAVSVALFLNRNSPFLNQEANASSASSPVHVEPQTSPLEILHPNGNHAVDTVPNIGEASAPETLDASISNANPSVNYDFYKVLPSSHKEDTNHLHSTKTSTVESNKTVNTPKRYLQLGAFQSERQADNLKAKLALIGIEAQIQSKDNGTMILHRVRVGPFQSQEALDRVRAQLKSNGIDSAISH